MRHRAIVWTNVEQEPDGYYGVTRFKQLTYIVCHHYHFTGWCVSKVSVSSLFVISLFRLDIRISSSAIDAATLWCRKSSGHGCIIGSHSFLWDVITHPYPDFRQTSVEVLRYGRVIASVIHYACNCLSIPTSVWVRISNFSMWRGWSLRSWGPWFNTGIHLMKQFAHYWYSPCCQCTETSYHDSFIQNDTYPFPHQFGYEHLIPPCVHWQILTSI